MLHPATALLIFCAIVCLCLLIFWPQHGLVGYWRWLHRMSRRVLREDALKHIYQTANDGQHSSLPSVAGSLEISPNQAADLLDDMVNRELIVIEADDILLTDAGRESALHIIRAHRLWEFYLADRTGFAETEWHSQAESREHRLSPEQLDELANRLGNPVFDPHGDPIPTKNGSLITPDSQPLISASVGQPLRVVHIEDEPPVVYEQLVAMGIYPGMTIQLLEKNAHRLRLWADDLEHVIAPILAHSISGTPLPDIERVDERPGHRLSHILPGKKSTIVQLSEKCRGAERRRLLDLGFVPGTVIETELSNPLGDPTGYLVRGTLIGLRREQADLIHVLPKETINEK